MRSRLLKYDRKLLSGPGGIIGVDEVGRGALAGPVIAAAAWLSCEFYERAGRIKGVSLINDSKMLTAQKREEIFELMEELAKKDLIKFCWAEGSVKEIEDYNILGASRLAMQRSLESLLPIIPEDYRIPKSSGMPLWDSLNTENQGTRAILLVDGLPLNPFDYEHKSIVEGDSHSLAIAMASIVAKVTRDSMMVELSQRYPVYGFEDHKGYGTEFHRAAIMKEGPADIHRSLFLRKVLEEAIELV